MSSRTSTSPGNRASHAGTADSRLPGRIQRTSRLRIRSANWLSFRPGINWDIGYLSGYARRSGAEQFRLRCGELVVAQHALTVQVGELVELVGHRRRGRLLTGVARGRDGGLLL